MLIADLRTIMTKVAIKTKPSDSKESDFHLALVDYLYKELKHNKLSVSRHNVMLKVALENKHLDKYEHLIIDCLEGKMYLRGKEIKDKYFGKLRRFQGGQRPADAYHCVVQSTMRIINRIKKLQTMLKGEEREVFGEVVERDDLRSRQDLRKYIQQDLRRKNVASISRFDLRKIANSQRQDLRKLAHDVDERSFAICYLDGKIYKGHTHAEAINKYLKENFDINLNELYMRPRIETNDIALPPYRQEDRENIFNNIKQIGFGSVIALDVLDDGYNGEVYLDDNSSVNLNMDDFINVIKKEYPEYEIYLESSHKKIACLDLRKIANIERKDLRKLAHDDGDRSFAICYLDGEIYEGETHASTIDQCLNNRFNLHLEDKYFRPNLDPSKSVNSFMKKDRENILNNIQSIGFGCVLTAKDGYEANRIYLDESTTNLSIRDFVQAVKAKYPGYEIYMDGGLHRKIACLDLRKVANLQRQDLRSISKVTKTDLRKIARINQIDCRKIKQAQIIIHDFRKKINAKLMKSIINKRLDLRSKTAKIDLRKIINN